jgi:UDP:flavonoid glycosyltransferase YjiC (YdhE family)
LALAVELRALGHHVTLAATPTFAGEAAAFDVDFHPIGVDVLALTRQPAFRHAFQSNAIRMLGELMREHLELQFDALPALASQADIIIGGGIELAGQSVAEAAGLPYGYVVYTSQAFPSRHHGPMLFSWQTPRMLRGLAWRVFKFGGNRLLRKSLNRRRRSIGLPPLGCVFRYLLPPGRTLLAVDPELSPVPPDVAATPVGAFHLADSRLLPPQVEAFLAAGDPPVYFGFGSMLTPDAAATTALILDAARRARCRAIVSAGWAGLGEIDAHDNVMTVGPVNHARLFPRMRAIVHHGGAGTTAAAARAGVPQLVIPHLLDQFAFGRRIHALGIGPAPRPRRELAEGDLHEPVTRMCTDEAMRARARDLGVALRARDGAATTARAFAQSDQCGWIQSEPNARPRMFSTEQDTPSPRARLS